MQSSKKKTTISKTAAIKKYLGPVVIIALIALRIFSATQLPTFYIDEAARGGLVRAVIAPEIPLDPTQHNPLFVHTDAEFSTLGFYGPASIWAFLFGTSEVSLRIFVTIISVLAILLLAKAISYWFSSHKKSAFLISAIIGLTLPWNFLQGMLFWDTTFAPVFIILSLWAFSYLYTAQSGSPKLRTLATILLPLGLILSTYFYKPVVFVAVFFYIYFLYLLKKQKIYSGKRLAITIAGSILLALPMAIFIFSDPAATERTAEVSFLISENPIRTLYDNIKGIFSPSFLFTEGDINGRHAIGVLGMLGAGAIVPIFVAFYARVTRKLEPLQKKLFLISIIGIILGSLGAILTNEEHPHSLRACGAWPFYTILIALGAHYLFQNFSRKLFFAAAAVFAASFITYMLFFFINYVPAAPNLYLRTAPEHYSKFYYTDVYYNR